MSASEDVLAVARHRILAEARAMAAVAQNLDEGFIEIARVLSSCKGKIFISGSGTSGAVARRMTHIFSVSGTPTVFLASMDALHGASGAVTDQDVVLLISYGGSSAEVIEFAKIAKARGAKVIGLTGSVNTLLAKASDLFAVVTVSDQADIGDTIATGITLAQSAWGDAMAEVLMRHSGYTWDQFMSTHPAGAVGQRSELPEDFPKLEF